MAGIPPPPAAPKSFPNASVTNFQRNLAFFGAQTNSAPESFRSSSSESSTQDDTSSQKDYEGYERGLPKSNRHTSFHNPHMTAAYSDQNVLREDFSAARMSFSLNRRSSGYANGAVNPNASLLSASTPSAMGNHNEVNALRNKVSELEYQLSKFQTSVGDLDQQKIDLDTLRLERDVAKRNCDILASNVDTLKALSLELATRLEQSVTQCSTLEENLTSANLKRELANFDQADNMRAEFAGKITMLEKALKEATATNEAAAKRFAVREVEQDERVKKLESIKDETILRLMKENETLQQALKAGNAHQQFQRSSSKALSSRPLTASAQLKRALHQHRTEPRMRLTEALPLAAPTPVSEPRKLSQNILTLTIDSINLAAADDLQRRSYHASHSSKNTKYHVDMRTHGKEITPIDSVEYQRIAAQRGAEASDLCEGHEWYYVTDHNNYIRVTMECL